MQTCIGKWIGILGVERVWWSGNLMEQLCGRVGLCAFEVLCRSGLEDGLFLRFGAWYTILGSGGIAYLHDKAEQGRNTRFRSVNMAVLRDLYARENQPPDFLVYNICFHQPSEHLPSSSIYSSNTQAPATHLFHHYIRYAFVNSPRAS